MRMGLVVEAIDAAESEDYWKIKAMAEVIEI